MKFLKSKFNKNKFSLGCDMVGFHIQDYCLNFVDCCQRSLGCRVDRKNLLVEHGGRTVRVRPLPIGIPFDRFVSLAETANKVISTNQKIVLGVDRLDYTKGLVNRLKAFEMLLEKHPEHREQVKMLLLSSYIQLQKDSFYIYTFNVCMQKQIFKLLKILTLDYYIVNI